MLQNEIDKLKLEIQQLEKKQEDCVHEFNNPIYTPEREWIPGSYDTNTRGHEITHPKWTKTCKHCGKIFTTKEELPDFWKDFVTIEF
jgi:hypothetical protein